MTAIFTGQEVRANLGDIRAHGASCTEWIDRMLSEMSGSKAPAAS